MRIKIYILTYDNAEALSDNLSSLYSNMGEKPSDVEIEVNIINNHSRFAIDEKYNVNVLHNALRPDWSTGHSSRNWNQAFLLGIQNLNHPACDILVNIQDDMIWSPDWLKGLLKIHETYDFYTCSWGDAFCSYKPEAVRKIGMWDERFCNLGYQEADYFLRALIYNKDKSSINDTGVGRVLNPVDMNGEPYIPDQAATEPSWISNSRFVANRRNLDTRMLRTLNSLEYHGVSLRMFHEKWPNIAPEFWTKELIDNPFQKPACPTYMFYPYFEKDIYDLPGKGYP